MMRQINQRNRVVLTDFRVVDDHGELGGLADYDHVQSLLINGFWSDDRKSGRCERGSRNCFQDIEVGHDA